MTDNKGGAQSCAVNDQRRTLYTITILDSLLLTESAVWEVGLISAGDMLYAVGKSCPVDQPKQRNVTPSAGLTMVIWHRCPWPRSPCRCKVLVLQYFCPYSTEYNRNNTTNWHKYSFQIYVTADNMCHLQLHIFTPGVALHVSVFTLCTLWNQLL